METSIAAEIFAALSQETRLAVLRLLIAAGPSGLPAGKVADRLGVPASTASFHLGALERSGLTQATRQSRQVIHAVRFAALRELLVFLTETCCSGHPELCGDISHLLPAMPNEGPVMTPAFNVLFLCTRNSARSIMAEALLEKHGAGRFRAYSAGSDPASEPMPGIMAMLQRFGHDTSKLHSKSWNLFTGPDAPRMDFVIVLCDVLHGQSCPDFGGTAVTAAWPLPDPASFSGRSTDQSLLLNELYGGLRRRIEIVASLPFAALDRMALKARLDELGGGGVVTLTEGRS